MSQLYHDGLLRLQAKDYGKAQELLESVLKDPLVSNAQVVSLIQFFSLLPFYLLFRVCYFCFRFVSIIVSVYGFSGGKHYK